MQKKFTPLVLPKPIVIVVRQWVYGNFGFEKYMILVNITKTFQNQIYVNRLTLYLYMEHLCGRMDKSGKIFVITGRKNNL